MRDLHESSYTPGTWVAITTATGCLLVDLVPEDPVVRRCWKLLSDEAGADAVLDALIGGGVAAAPGFALAIDGPDHTRVVARHPGVVLAHHADHDESVIEAQPATSWVDVLVAGDVDALTLRGPATVTSVELPMGTGVTSASVVQLRAGAPSEQDPIISKTASPVTAAPPPPVPAPQPASAPPPVPEAPVQPVPTAAASETEAESESDESYDHLFGASVQRPAPPLPVEQTAGWLTEPPRAVQRPRPVEPTSPTELIEGVPWAGSEVSANAAAPTPSQPTPPPASVGSDSGTATDPAATHDSDDPDGYGATVNRAQLRAQAGPPGPTVLAGRCPSGHVSPPYADRCRICRAAMPAQDAFEIARPQLGVLTLDSGDVVTLDRGVLLGRSPDVPAGPDRPHVLRLQSPENDISRNHAEIVLDGWNVYVRDLGSTNGTTVELPGRAPVRVRENELSLVEDRTRITLADEATIVFEVRE